LDDLKNNCSIVFTLKTHSTPINLLDELCGTTQLHTDDEVTCSARDYPTTYVLCC